MICYVCSFSCVLFWRYYFDVRSPYALFVHSHAFPVTMDFKGFQYQGIIHPGPTAMIASVNKGGVMKVEAITDEFVTLEKDVIDVMARLDAQVKGDLDEGYSTKGHDTNVNYSGARGGGNDSAATNDGAGGNKKGGGGKFYSRRVPETPVLNPRIRGGERFLATSLCWHGQ